MKTANTVIITFLASVLFSFPTLAQEDRDKDVISISPPPGSSYKQITVGEAQKMKNYIPSDQYEVSIQGEYSKTETDTKKNDK